jgi:hypothetical protein
MLKSDNTFFFSFLFSLIFPFNLNLGISHNSGEYELTMDGIHENILRLSYHDPMMHKTVSTFWTLLFAKTYIFFSYNVLFENHWYW